MMLASAVPMSSDLMIVADLMTRDPVTCVETDTLDVVGELMGRGGFRGVPVVDDADRLLGIITESDLREHKGYLDRTKVSGAMTEEPVVLSPEQTVSAAAGILLEKKVNALPVVDSDGGLVGIVSVSDLLRVLASGSS